MPYSRRDIGRLALTGLPVGLPLSSSPDTGQRRAAPSESRWEGIQLGLHVPPNLVSGQLSPADILGRWLALGIGVIELSATVIEGFLGVPALPACLLPVPENGLDLGLHPLEEEVLQDEVALARTTLNDQITRWRSSVSLTPLSEVRRHYEDAGVRIDIVEWDGLMLLSDPEVDHAFRVAKALGARALSTELHAGGPRRLAAMAGRHGVTVGFRGDEAIGADDFDGALSHGSFVGASVDLAAWTAGGHGSPLPFLEEHGRRVTHVLLTDGVAGGRRRVPLGAGNAPVCEVLEAMLRWPMGPAIIDLPEPAEADADRMSEIVRAVDYCRACLTRHRATA